MRPCTKALWTGPMKSTKCLEAFPHLMGQFKAVYYLLDVLPGRRTTHWVKLSKLLIVGRLGTARRLHFLGHWPLEHRFNPPPPFYTGDRVDKFRDRKTVRPLLLREFVVVDDTSCITFLNEMIEFSDNLLATEPDPTWALICRKLPICRQGPNSERGSDNFWFSWGMQTPNVYWYPVMTKHMHQSPKRFISFDRNARNGL